MTIRATSSPKMRFGRTFGRVAIAAATAAALSLAMVAPANAETRTGGIQGQNGVPSRIDLSPDGALVLVSQPSEHCGYYHWVLDPGSIVIGDAYGCLANASINTYHAWVICSEAKGQIPSPTRSRGNFTAVDCGDHQGHPTNGGFTRDS